MSKPNAKGGTYQIRKPAAKRGQRLGKLGAASKVRRIDPASPEGQAITGRRPHGVLLDDIADQPDSGWLNDWQRTSEPT